MFDSLFKMVWGESDEEPPQELIPAVEDPWGGSEESYVAKLRPYVDSIAKAMGDDVFTRFNLTRGCAELYRAESGVIARVYASGHGGVPKRATITSPQPLSDTAKALFETTLPVVLEFRVMNI